MSIFFPKQSWDHEPIIWHFWQWIMSEISKIERAQVQWSKPVCSSVVDHEGAPYFTIFLPYVKYMFKFCKIDKYNINLKMKINLEKSLNIHKSIMMNNIHNFPVFKILAMNKCNRFQKFVWLEEFVGKVFTSWNMHIH